MFVKTVQVIEQSKIVVVRFANPLANQKLFFRPDGLLNGKKITAIQVLTGDVEITSGSFQYMGDTVTTITAAGAAQYTFTLMGKNGNFILDQFPLSALTKVKTDSNYKTPKRFNDLDIRLEDSFCTFQAVGVGVAHTAIFFEFFYRD